MASPILDFKPRRKRPKICKVVSSKKEDFPKSDTTTNDDYITPQSSLEEGWKVVPPMWLNKNVISDIVTFKSLVERDHKLLIEHEEVITYLLKEHSEMREEIQILKSQSNSQQESDEWGVSKQNARFLEDLFNLPKTTRKSVEDILNELDGCLRSYSDPENDVLDDIQSIRYGW